MPVTLIRSSWSSGSLIFHESTSVAPSTTYDVLTIGTGAVKVGNTANDVDFQYYGTGSLSAIIDCGAATFTLTGISISSNSAIATTSTISNAMTATSATPGTSRAIYGKYTTFTTMTSGNLVGVRGEVTMGGNGSGTAYVYGCQGKAIVGATTWTGTSLCGLYGQIDVAGSTITSGHVAAIQANIYGATSGTIPMEGIYVEHAGGGVINSLIQLFGKSTYVFDIASNTHDNVATTGTVTTDDGYIKVNIDGSTRYIGLGATVA